MVFNICFWNFQTEEPINVNLKEELQCPVYTECFVRPRECIACGRLFCSSCIAHLKSCPLCRAEPFLTRDNRFASRLVDNIQVQCERCDVQVARSQFEEHKKTCANRLRKCSFKGCGFNASTKEDALAHVKAAHMDQIWTNFEQLSQIICPAGILNVICR